MKKDFPALMLGFCLLLLPLVAGAEKNSPDFFPSEIDDLIGFDHFSSKFEEMKEEPLLSVEGPNVYRFTWFDTHNGIYLIRLVFLENGEAILTEKRYDGGGTLGIVTGSEVFTRTESFDRTKSDEIRRRLRLSDFSGREIFGPRMFAWLDGSMWLFEMKENQKYHAVFRQNPVETLGAHLNPSSGGYADSYDSWRKDYRTFVSAVLRLLELVEESGLPEELKIEPNDRGNG